MELSNQKLKSKDKQPSIHIPKPLTLSMSPLLLNKDIKKTSSFQLKKRDSNPEYVV